MGNKKITQLRFREINRDIFEAIKNGKKKIETRAATIRFRNIKDGDTIKLVCGKENYKKQVLKAEFFKNIKEILKIYKPEDINPKIHSNRELERMWCSFPNYKEKIKKYGLIALKLK